MIIFCGVDSGKIVALVALVTIVAVVALVEFAFVYGQTTAILRRKGQLASS